MAFDQDAWRATWITRAEAETIAGDLPPHRAENYDLLKGLVETAFERAGNHTENGPMTLLRLLEGYAGTPRPTPPVAEIREEFKRVKGKK